MANENPGDVKDLSSSKTAALQALLGSFRQATGENQSAPGLSRDELQKLSAKIEEILEDGLLQKDGQGELLNNEGLPIVEITEPITPLSETQDGLHFTQEPDLIPLQMLQPSERERRRRERDRIFDILEEEERAQQLREEHGEAESRKEEIQRRKEAARMEYEHLKQMKELQKKLGKALVGSTSGSSKTDPDSQRQTASVSKKSVTSAETVTSDVIATEKKQSSQVDCGDITAGRLRSLYRVPPVSAARTDQHVMKVQVVERRGANTSGSTLGRVVDSDDESPTPSEHSSSQQCITKLCNVKQQDLSTNDTSSDEAQSSDEALDEHFDWDSAQHRREVALEYFAKRHVIGTDVRALATGNDDDDESECVSEGGGSQRVPISRFRADRMAEAYNKTHPQLSTSLGSTIVPEARRKAIRNSIRMGKLVNDELAGGPSGDSGSEDEDVKEMIDALKKGNVQNIGPTTQSVSSSVDDLPSFPTNAGVLASGARPLSTVRERAQLPQRQGSHSGSSEGPPIVLSSVPEGTAEPKSSVADGRGMEKRKSRFMAERHK